MLGKSIGNAQRNFDSDDDNMNPRRSYFKIGALLAVLSVAEIRGHRPQRDPRDQYQEQAAASALVPQVGAVPDTQAEASGFLGAGAVQAHAKYFQYAHVPQKDHYEVGHRKGNEHHFTERHEKAHPHEGEFKTKVRWGDKHGGYGEHYWDFNHAGHGGDSHDEGSEQVSDYEQADEAPREKRQPKPEVKRFPLLIYDHSTGQVKDQVTGQVYRLQPVRIAQKN